tara:strand:+ start:156 stop:596 length:441 start_codon:yes stop_codon:yes gene_type:complete
MQIELTKNELCFVDDSLTLYRELDDSDLSKYVHRVVAPSAGAAASAELLSKLGGALIESHEQQRAGKHPKAPVELTEPELWLLREISNSNAIYNKEPVGLNIKLKIHKALREIYAGSILDEIPDSSIEEQGYDKNEIHFYNYPEDE